MSDTIIREILSTNLIKTICSLKSWYGPTIISQDFDFYRLDYKTTISGVHASQIYYINFCLSLSGFKSQAFDNDTELQFEQLITEWINTTEPSVFIGLYCIRLFYLTSLCFHCHNHLAGGYTRLIIIFTPIFLSSHNDIMSL